MEENPDTSSVTTFNQTNCCASSCTDIRYNVLLHKKTPTVEGQAVTVYTEESCCQNCYDIYGPNVA